MTAATLIPRGKSATLETFARVATHTPTGIPATYVALPDGRAWVTIGQISSFYANASHARAHLQAMERRGEVCVHWREAAPC
jgi:hypothetical protein